MIEDSVTRSATGMLEWHPAQPRDLRMTTRPLIELSQLLWKFVMSRPEIREAHAAYVGTTEFLTTGDRVKKIEGRVRAIQAGQTLTDAERTLVTQIQAAIAA
jgi:hypothetical protein